MSRVLIGRQREAQPFDLMREHAGEDMFRDALKGLFPEEQIEAVFNVPDTIAEFAYGLSQTAEGRELFEWILDCTLRMPYRPTRGSLEETALNAAKREGINYPAELILAAITRGEKTVFARASGAKQ